MFPNKLKTENHNVVLLAGGVGGAKLAGGLAQIIPAGQLTIIGNTGDDFQHAGLTICPDLDTLMYTLAGVANPSTGWGRQDESWHTLTEITQLGGPDWFRLGDLDLATHLTRTDLLANGATLTEATQHLCQKLAVEHALLPMTDMPAPTTIETEEGILPFQTYFVQQKWQPVIQKIHLPNNVQATPAVLWALEKADIVIFAPSNPFVSVDPILNTYPIRAMITDLPKAVVAVSPIIAGQAVKGPAAKMMREMGFPVTSAAVAGYYQELVDLFVYDSQDKGQLNDFAGETLCTDTIMRNPAGQARLAVEIMDTVMELLTT